MARPLHDLTKKDTPWQWNKEQQEAFDSIKWQFCTEPILKVYDPELPTQVEVDTSGFATGGILSQKHDDGLWHPVAYRSQSMSKEERNYEIYMSRQYDFIFSFMRTFFFLVYFTLSHVTLLSHGSHVQSHDGSPDLSHDEGT